MENAWKYGTNLVSYGGVKRHDSRRRREDSKHYKVLTAILMDVHFTAIVITKLDDGQNAYNFMFWCNLIAIWNDVLAIRIDAFHFSAICVVAGYVFILVKKASSSCKFTRMHVAIIAVFIVDLLMINAIYFTLKNFMILWRIGFKCNWVSIYGCDSERKMELKLNLPS